MYNQAEEMVMVTVHGGGSNPMSLESPCCWAPDNGCKFPLFCLFGLLIQEDVGSAPYSGRRQMVCSGTALFR